MLIGAHVSIAGGVSRAFERAQGFRAKSLQIFTKTARGWLGPPLDSEEQSAFRLEARRTGALDDVHAQTPGFRARIAIEVTAGQGNCLGWRFEHIAEILACARRGDRLGVCLDTCHLFAAGYDISTPKGYESVMTELDRIVGLQRITSFHLNDCKKPLGCRVDRHEEIGKGTLGLTAFRCLVRDGRFRDCVAVLETPFPRRYGRAIRLLESLARQGCA